MAELDSITEVILEDYLNTVKKEIFISQENLQITASGFSERNTKVSKGSHSNQAFLSSPAYLTTNFDGVGIRAGKIFPLRQMSQWLIHKNLPGVRGEDGRFLSRKQQQYLIARKIWTQGTDIYNGAPGIPINMILKANLPKTGRKLAQAYAREMAASIKRASK
jgi:hypothetical protein